MIERVALMFIISYPSPTDPPTKEDCQSIRQIRVDVMWIMLSRIPFLLLIIVPMRFSLVSKKLFFIYFLECPFILHMAENAS